MAKVQIPKAEMLYDSDGEPWALYMRGHVPKGKFFAEAKKLLRYDAYVRESLAEAKINITKKSEQHLHLRVKRNWDDDMGTIYVWCKPTAKTGFPVTALAFQCPTPPSKEGR